MILPLNQVIVGDCVEVMRDWPADSIDLVVTSPPYWGLRDYGADTVRVWGGLPACEHEWDESESGLAHENRNFSSGSQEEVHGEKETTWIRKYDSKKSGFCVKCGAWRGSLGLEPHPQQFIDHLTEICREIKRVLKPTGTFFLNLGDTYFGGKGKSANRWSESHTDRDTLQREAWNLGRDKPQDIARQDGTWLQPKQKLMIPARVAITLQHDGWILRSDIIWHKPNHMPSPVKDRLTNAYEHFFLFAKARRYYFDLDAIRKPHKDASLKRYKSPLKMYGNKDDGISRNDFGREMQDAWSPLGKNPGDLWRIPTKPFPGAHFATFPPKLIEPIIKAGSPRWICTKCGKPRTRITKKGATGKIRGDPQPFFEHTPEKGSDTRIQFQEGVYYETVGWSDCGCGEKWVGGIVLDPFGGSGTVGKVARKLGRRFIIIEIKPEYADMARQRVRGRYKSIPEGVTPFTQDMEAESNG